MSLVAFFSAKGAPGTTTAAMLVAALWPRRALLVDADAAGGDVALRLPGPDGRPLELTTGMLGLLPLARRALGPAQLLAQAQPVLGGGEVIAGLSGPEQAGAAGPVWASLAEAFAGLDAHDVVLDLGRLAATSVVLPLAARADLAVLVLRDSVSGVFTARSRLRALLPALTDATGAGPQLGVIVSGESERNCAGAASVIAAEFPRVRYFGRLAWDPAGARLFDGEPVARPERTLLVRSGRAVTGALDEALQAVRLLRGGAVPAPGGGDPPAPGAPAPASPAVGVPASPRLSRSEERAAERAGRRPRLRSRAAGPEPGGGLDVATPGGRRHSRDRDGGTA